MLINRFILKPFPLNKLIRKRLQPCADVDLQSFRNQSCFKDTGFEISINFFRLKLIYLRVFRILETLHLIGRSCLAFQNGR